MMSTIIDELIVTLGLDAAKFRSEADKTQAVLTRVGRNAVKESKELEENLRKTQDSTGKRLKQTEEVGRQSSQQLNKFRIEVAALLSTLAAGFGIQQFVKNLANTAAETGRVAKNTGMSTEALFLWQEMAKRFGGTAEATSGSLLGLRNQFEKLSVGGMSEILPYLRQLRVAWADSTGAMLPMTTILDNLHKAVQGMDKPRANFLLKGLGLDQGTIDILTQTDEAYQKLKAHVTGLGLLTPDQVAASQAFEKSLADLNQTFTNLANVILPALLPQISAFIEEMTKWLSSPENQKFISDEFLAGISGLGSLIMHTIELFTQWHGAALALAEFISVRWLAVMMFGLGPVSAAIGVIVAGLLSIQQASKFLDPGQYSNNSPFWNFIGKEEQLKYKNSPESRKARGEEERDPNAIDWQHPSSWFGGSKGSASNERKATVRDSLANELGISKESASGIVSNLDAESGIRGINEKNPTVPGSRGGFGWAQWTGPRRVEFEQYATAHGMDPASDAANQGFLVQELRTKFPGVLAQLQRGGITATESADIVARGYIIPPGDKISGHIAGAKSIASLNLGNQAASQNVVDSSVGRWGNMGSAQRDSTASANAPAAQGAVVSTNINGPITVNTSATDADGIARSLGTALKKYAYVPQSNTGLA